MGFWDKAFQAAVDLGTTAANALNEKANEIRQLKDKYESMADEELVRIANSDGFFAKSSTEKAVALSTLKTRGFSDTDIRSQ